MKYQFENDEIKKCGRCPLFTTEEIDYNEFAQVCGKTRDYVLYEDKPNWCPLVEVQDEKL